MVAIEWYNLGCDQLEIQMLDSRNQAIDLITPKLKSEADFMVWSVVYNAVDTRINFLMYLQNRVID